MDKTPPNSSFLRNLLISGSLAVAITGCADGSSSHKKSKKSQEIVITLHGNQVISFGLNGELPEQITYDSSAKQDLTAYKDSDGEISIAYTHSNGWDIITRKIKPGAIEQKITDTPLARDWNAAVDPTAIILLYDAETGQQTNTYDINVVDFSDLNNHQTLITEARYATFFKDGKRIVYVNTATGNTLQIADIDLTTFPPTLSNVQSLPVTDAIDLEVGPKDRRIAFSESGDVKYIDLNTNLLTNITAGNGNNTSPSWNKNGDELFICSDRSPNGVLHVYKTNIRYNTSLQLTAGLVDHHSISLIDTSD